MSDMAQPNPALQQNVGTAVETHPHHEHHEHEHGHEHGHEHAMQPPVQQQQEVSSMGKHEHQGHQVPFKERVIGVAKKTRGTALGKPELKEHGEQILAGVATHEAPVNTQAPPTNNTFSS